MSHSLNNWLGFPSKLTELNYTCEKSIWSLYHCELESICTIKFQERLNFGKLGSAAQIICKAIIIIMSQTRRTYLTRLLYMVNGSSGRLLTMCHVQVCKRLSDLYDE